MPDNFSARNEFVDEVEAFAVKLKNPDFNPLDRVEDQEMMLNIGLFRMNLSAYQTKFWTQMKYILFFRSYTKIINDISDYQKCDFMVNIILSGMGRKEHIVPLHWHDAMIEYSNEHGDL